MPPNYEVGPCRGNATHPTDPGLRSFWIDICDQFPLYMHIDYIRIYQDTRTSQSQPQAIGCDPKSHPTKEFITAHISNYTDDKNPWIPVAGGATCRDDDDCTTKDGGFPTGRYLSIYLSTYFSIHLSIYLNIFKVSVWHGLTRCS